MGVASDKVMIIKMYGAYTLLCCGCNNRRLYYCKQEQDASFARVERLMICVCSNEAVSPITLCLRDEYHSSCVFKASKTLKQSAAVGPANERIDEVFGMRHQPQDIEVLGINPGDVIG
jgi:hypothetical protein